MPGGLYGLPAPSPVGSAPRVVPYSVGSKYVPTLVALTAATGGGTVTLPALPQFGDIIAVYVASIQADSAATCSGAGAAWTLVTSANDSSTGTQDYTALFLGIVGLVPTTSITVTWNNQGAAFALGFRGWRGQVAVSRSATTLTGAMPLLSASNGPVLAGSLIVAGGNWRGASVLAGAFTGAGPSSPGTLPVLNTANQGGCMSVACGRHYGGYADWMTSNTGVQAASIMMIQ